MAAPGIPDASLVCMDLYGALPLPIWRRNERLMPLSGILQPLCKRAGTPDHHSETGRSISGIFFQTLTRNSL